ncbi:MAG: inner membrane protein YiaA [Dysgonomonas sp.]|nr:inner membrane protein YiaA [Dysgonomonas sp.]
MEEEEIGKPDTFRKKGNNLSPAYVGATWAVLIIGIVCYLVGLYNAEMELNEKGYYFTILLFGLFSVVTLQKSVRDKMEGIRVTNIFFAISWFGTIVSILLLIVGLWNAELLLSEKGFYGIAFLMSMYAAISVQKNIRDSEHEE